MKIKKKITKILKKIECILDNEKKINNIEEELNILGNKNELNVMYFDGVLKKDFFNEVDNISKYVINKVNIIKEYILSKNIDCLEIQKIEYILGLLIKVQSGNINIIRRKIAELKNDRFIVYDFNLFSPKAIPIYQEHIDIYMKKIGFNN